MIKQICTLVLLFLMAAVVAAQDNKPEPELVDEFSGNIPGEDLLARIDMFSSRFYNDPTTSGVMLVHGPSGTGGGSAEYIGKSIMDHIVKEKGIDPARLRTINGGPFETLTGSRIQFWVLPPGADPPNPVPYEGEARTARGKVADFVGYEDFGGEEIEQWGPRLGSVRTAGIADALREQPNTVLYLVAYDFQNSLPGAWKRIAEDEVKDFSVKGIPIERLRIVYGGRKESEEEVTEYPAEPKIELWLVSRDAPPPVKEARQSDRVAMALRIGSYVGYLPPAGDDEERFLQAIEDALRRDPQVRVQFAVEIVVSEPVEEDKDEEFEKVDLKVLAGEWLKKLASRKGIDSSRIIVSERKVEEEWQIDSVEIWLLPPGVEIPKDEEGQP